MSTKTFFKRAALVVVASLGLGMLSGPSSQAYGTTGLTTLVNPSLTLSASTATATLGDSTAVYSWTTKFSTNDATFGDSVTVRYTCDAPSGVSSCPAIKARQLQSADTANVIPQTDRNGGATPANASWVNISSAGWTDTASAGANTSARSVVSFKAEQFSKIGTYTYNFYLTGGDGRITTQLTGTAVSWVVTVSAPNTAGASLSRKYISSDVTTAMLNRLSQAPSSDSAIVAVAGTATSPAIVGYAFVTLANSAGDTRVAAGSSYLTVDESLTVTVNGPGMIALGVGTGGTTASTYTGAKALSGTTAVNSQNNWGVARSGETIVVLKIGRAHV